jgi:hypothetical protein
MTVSSHESSEFLRQIINICISRYTSEFKAAKRPEI